MSASGQKQTSADVGNAFALRLIPDIVRLVSALKSERNSKNNAALCDGFLLSLG